MRGRWPAVRIVLACLLLAVAAISGGVIGGPTTTHATEHSLTVRIEPGWNNVVYFGAQRPVSEVIAEVGCVVTRVSAWEGTSQSWRSYHAALPAFLSDLELVTPYMSLRLLNEGAVTTWTQTAAPVARTVPLSAGWNSVGWTGEDGVPLGDAFGDLEAANALVWDPLGQAYDAFATAAPPFINTLDALDFGNAVWVLVPDAQEWRMGGAGIITTVAGGQGDGGPATAAWLEVPRGVALDGAGHLFIADAANHRIRRVAGVAVPVTISLGIGPGR